MSDAHSKLIAGIGKRHDIGPHGRSGRTSRMVEEAKRLSLLGKSVYLVVPAGLVKLFAASLEDYHGIAVESLGSVGNFNHKTMRTYGAWPNVEFLFDHFVLEQEFAAVVAEIHRFDAPPIDPKAEYHQLVRDNAAMKLDHDALVRELDKLLNGNGAAKQASLCDIVSQVRREGIKSASFTELTREELIGMSTEDYIKHQRNIK